MTRDSTHALSDVLDQLEDGLTDEQVCVRDIVDASGCSSFAFPGAWPRQGQFLIICFELFSTLRKAIAFTIHLKN